MNDYYYIYYNIVNRIYNMKARLERKNATAAGVTHKMKILGNRGKFLLVVCLNCKERNLAKDRAEAEEIYSKLACLHI